jgi:thiamine pyrophosphokinase
VNKLFDAMNRQKAQTDHNVTDFEKNLGLILKKFNETEENENEDPIEDA